MLATHGRSGISRLWLGSVAEALLRTSAVPLLLIRPHESADEERWRRPEPIQRVLAPLEPGDVAVQAIEPARRLGETFGAAMSLIRVISWPYEALDSLTPGGLVFASGDLPAARARAVTDLEQIAATIRAQGTPVSVDVVDDLVPARGILGYAREHGSDVIAMTTHARTGFERLLLGSVADKVARGADGPVLLVPAAAG